MKTQIIDNEETRSNVSTQCSVFQPETNTVHTCMKYTTERNVHVAQYIVLLFDDYCTS